MGMKFTLKVRKEHRVRVYETREESIWIKGKEMA